VDAHGKHQERWNFRSGWLVEWIGPSSGDKGGAAAIDALDIAYEDLRRA
jgi:hypothetical protein